MKSLKLAQIPACTLAGLLFVGCSVEKTQDGKMPDVDVEADAGNLPEYKIVKTEEGEMPDVDVDVEGGQLPKYDVDMADVDVKTKTETITVPKVKVVLEEEEVEVPYVDISFDDDEIDAREKQQQTLSIAARTGMAGQSLEIQEVIYSENELYVLAKVSGQASESSEPKILRDEISVNAPVIDINYYIVADEGSDIESVHQDFEVVASRDELGLNWSDSKTVYKR